MQAVGKLRRYLSSGAYRVSGPFLPFGGAVDIVVVQQKDGSFKSSPWYVRFGKLHRVLKPNEKIEVNISVNGVEPDFHLYVNHKGEAFFVNEEDEESVLYSSSSGDEIDDAQSPGSRVHFRSKSYNFDSDKLISAARVDANNGKIVDRTGSGRARILGLVFGQRSFKGGNEDGVELMERAEIAADLLELKWSTNLPYDQPPHRGSKKGIGNNMENGLYPSKIKEEGCSCSGQDDLSSKSNFEVPEKTGKEENGINVSCLSAADNVVQNVAVNEIPVSRRRVNFAEDGEFVRNGKDVVYDTTRPDLQLHGEEVQCLPSGECGQVQDHADVFGAATGVVPEVRDCSHSDVGMMYDVADAGNPHKFQKSRTINLGRTRCSAKKLRAKTPTSEQLASLNLKEGRNIVTFSFSTTMLGTRQVDARIYLWKWNTRIVISDVDGTITRSDVLGQFMPLVGIDWSQTGVAHLFSAIQENGYQLLFLSARAISQAYHTRQFLFNLNQDGKVLPDGPVVISPDGLFPSLYREVILRAPHEFKIACLEDIRALFPPDCNPFYAGFGNRDTDEISYLKVGIPKGKIFIINPRGEIVVNRCVDTKSYTSLHAVVNGMFPPTNSSEQEDFNSWNYWKVPLLS
ncbi:PREDICTED: phosphatidate phosphatase PAH2-like [Lupinus angustifolius]|uniref:phosphatidate phosphatase PAH2-like n=1 Tax=Lupinus angustifolius TaxID=3871 RepID=UPI00092E228F|nr:PREDICTED: phosphatidate phosphatase PAH2-like [Lupinus angustifolius]